MKWVVNILGIILTLAGILWFLQGVNIFRGSAMSGQSQWTFIGLSLAIVGIAILVFYNRRSRIAKTS